MGRTTVRAGEQASISPGQDLGGRLRQARELRQESKSLSAVAQAADISTAYLQKLEVGDVKQPSPHVLHSLSLTSTTRNLCVSRVTLFPTRLPVESAGATNSPTH